MATARAWAAAADAWMAAAVSWLLVAESRLRRRASYTAAATKGLAAVKASDHADARAHEARRMAFVRAQVASTEKETVAQHGKYTWQAPVTKTTRAHVPPATVASNKTAMTVAVAAADAKRPVAPQSILLARNSTPETGFQSGAGQSSSMAGTSAATPPNSCAKYPRVQGQSRPAVAAPHAAHAFAVASAGAALKLQLRRWMKEDSLPQMATRWARRGPPQRLEMASLKQEAQEAQS